MKVFRNRMLMVVLVLMLVGMGCGGHAGSPTADDADDAGNTATPATVPTISSIVDGNDVAVETTGTTNVNPTAFTVTFSEAMDDTTVTADNLTLACGGLEAVLGFEFDTEKKILTITPEGAYVHQLTECLLTFSTGIKDAEATAMAEAAYTFTPGCAVADTFNADSHSCWQVATGGGVNWTSWPDLLADGVFSFANSGMLDYSSAGTTPATRAAIYKEVVVDSAGFDIAFHIKSSSGLTSGDSIFVSLAEEAHGAGRSLQIGLNTDPGGVSCQINYIVDNMPVSSSQARCISNVSSQYYIKLRVEDRRISTTYSTDGVTYNSLDSIMAAWPTDQDFTDLSYLTLKFYAVSANITASIGEIYVNGLTVTDQY